MTPWTLVDVERALRGSWAADTCPSDHLARAGWDHANPAWGHCDITALVVNDLLGGDLMLGKVYATDGGHQGFHWWNRPAGGVEIDLTRERFRDGRRIVEARVVKRPAGRPKRRAKEYDLLRGRVAARIGPLPTWIATGSGTSHEPSDRPYTDK